MTTEGVLAAAFLPTDGYIDPASVTQAIAKGARMRNAQIFENTKVTSITVDGRRASTVHTEQGDIACEMVVNAAGMWGMEIGRMAGVRIPAVAVEHQYVLTGPIPDFTPAELRQMPTMRDPDLLVYYKPDGPGLLIGGYEPDTLPFGHEGVPTPFQRQLLEPNFDRFEQLATLAAQRTPVIEQAGIRTMINGPIPYSADADFVMGKVPELDNYYVATGFLYGIAAGGGAGKMMAEWILEGRPSLDLWPLDVRRFAFHHTTHHFMGSRMVELYAHHYKLAAPGTEHVTSRGVKRSPLHDSLAGQGAVFGSRGGWERPNWFAPAGTEAVDRPSFGEPNWFPHVAEEHRAVRERVALHRPDLVRQVRDRRAWRARRGAVAVGRRHGQVDRHRDLHATVQPARRDRMRPDDDARSASSTGTSSPVRPSARTTWVGSAPTHPTTEACRSATSPLPTR